MIYELTVSLLLGALGIQEYFRKKDTMLAKEWRVARKRTNNYIEYFRPHLDTTLWYAGCIQEVEAVNLYRTTAYKELLRKEHLALVAYYESEPSRIDALELMEAWTHTQDDKQLFDRICKLIPNAEMP
jgi:hypothetical protein